MTAFTLDGLGPEAARWAEQHRDQLREQINMQAAADQPRPQWPSEQARLAFRARIRERLHRQRTPAEIAELQAWRAEFLGEGT
jgi:hypothetical protein